MKKRKTEKRKYIQYEKKAKSETERQLVLKKYQYNSLDEKKIAKIKTKKLLGKKSGYHFIKRKGQKKFTRKKRIRVLVDWRLKAGRKKEHGTFELNVKVIEHKIIRKAIQEEISLFGYKFQYYYGAIVLVNKQGKDVRKWELTYDLHEITR